MQIGRTTQWINQVKGDTRDGICRGGAAIFKGKMQLERVRNHGQGCRGVVRDVAATIAYDTVKCGSGIGQPQPIKLENSICGAANIDPVGEVGAAAPPLIGLPPPPLE